MEKIMWKINFKYLTIFAISALTIINFNSSAYCFDDAETHPKMTEKAAKRPVFIDYLQNELGFPEGLNKKISPYWFPEYKTIQQWLQQGSTDEDSPTCRASNHFHDPLKTWDSSYVTDSPVLIQKWCRDIPPVWPQYSNITWATGYKSSDEKLLTPMDRQDMSWDNARSYFFSALTATVPVDRDDYFVKTFRSVGQVLHLLEDMAVPAHVRNDFQSHLVFNGIKGNSVLAPISWWGNAFEYYVKLNPGLISSAMPSVPAFSSPQVTDFWDTDSNGNVPGLAEFSNANYFSNETIPGNNPTLVHTFPLPQPTGKYDCKDTSPGSGGAKTRYVSREPCPSAPGGKVDHFVAFSFLTPEAEIKALTANPSKRKYVIDNNVYYTYANGSNGSDGLLAKAIGYSAALLDYFFRGKIKLEIAGTDNSNSLIHLKATNVTANNEQMPAGDVSLVLRYRMIQTNDQPSSIMEGGGYEYKVFPYAGQSAIPTGAGTEFTFNISTNSLPDWANDVTAQLVYKGQLGNEAGAVAVGSLPIKVTPKAILISLPDSGAYAASDGTEPFKQITLKANTELTNGLNVAGGVFQLVLIHRFSADDPYQGSEVATLPTNQNSYYVIRATELNGINSLATGVAKELTFDISATPIPLTASDVHIYLVYKANQNDPDTSALAVGYLDISEPTPIDVYNNTDKVCLNGTWHAAGSTEAIVFANLTDVYPHRISNIYYQSGTASTAGSGNFLLSSTAALEPGSGKRLGYILTDYYFSHSMSESVTNLSNYDTWVLDYSDLTTAAEGFVNQHNMGNMQGYSGMYNMRGYKMHGGAGTVFDNQEYPEGVNCSWGLLNDPPTP